VNMTGLASDFGIPCNGSVVDILQLRNSRPLNLEGVSLEKRQLSRDTVHRIGCCARLLFFASSEHIGGIFLTGISLNISPPYN
jgi:hypothetical protein